MPNEFRDSPPETGTTSEVAGELKHDAARLKDNVAARAKQEAESRKGAAVSVAGSASSALDSAAQDLRDGMRQGTLKGWAQVRCASLDRLPMVGAVPDIEALHAHMAQAGARRGKVPLADTPRHPGLYMLSALGSRGISLAAWCASRLAAMMDAELASDEDEDLLRALDPARFAWKLARRQQRT